jgi:predicted metal-dependent hydrolase
MMQMGLPFGRQEKTKGPDVVVLDGHPVTVTCVRNRRARHYILRVNAAGGVRVTVPWHGSKAEALRFVTERHEWIVRERHRRAVRAASARPWADGTPVLFNGQEYPLRVTPSGPSRIRVSFADQVFMTNAEHAANLRRAVEVYLRRVATVDLPERLGRLALQHGFDVAAVSIRNQRSRWGSCSPTGRISLNWRLVQFPPRVAEYVLIHELAHLRHMDHSRRFWAEVGRLCPDYQASRVWLRTHHRTREDTL